MSDNFPESNDVIQFNSPRIYGKRLKQEETLLNEIHEAKKYVVFIGHKGTVHVIPDAKFEEIKESERRRVEENLFRDPTPILRGNQIKMTREAKEALLNAIVVVNLHN